MEIHVHNVVDVQVEDVVMRESGDGVPDFTVKHIKLLTDDGVELTVKAFSQGAVPLPFRDTGCRVRS